MVPIGKAAISVALLHPQVCFSISKSNTKQNRVCRLVKTVRRLPVWSFHQHPRSLPQRECLRFQICPKHFSGESHFPNTIPVLSLPWWSPRISRVCVCVCVCVWERERERSASDCLESSKSIFKTSTLQWTCRISRMYHGGLCTEIQGKN